MIWARRLFGLVAMAAMIWLIVFSDGKGLVMDWLNERQYPVFWIVIVTSAIYALALAVPFLPAVELGWMVMAAFGTLGIISVWLATPLGLLIAFSLGYWMRDWPVLTRLRQRFQQEVGAAEDHKATLRTRLLLYAGRRMAAHPYLTLAILVNLPGNWIIGGGGGIGMMAGASGLYRPLPYFLILIPATGVVAILMLLGVRV